MRYSVIAATLLLLPALLATDAMAAGPGPGIQIVNTNYIITDNYNVGPNVPRGRSYDYNYRGYRDYGRPYRHGFQSHNEAVARIQATHSPYRQTYHPRSFYNSPPVHYHW